MRIGRRVSNRIGDNGYSLIELIVVISIMAVMVGIMSFGISMMFTRDANYVAVRIDDELTEARTLAMSRDGVFTYVLHMDNDPSGDQKGGFIRIDQTITVIGEGGTETTTTTEYKKVLLDKGVTISVTGTGVPSSGDIGIRFSKSKGNVQEIGSVTAEPDGVYSKESDASGVYTITVTSKKNSSKIKTVTLNSITGRHYTEK